MKKGMVIEVIASLMILLFTYTAISKLYNHETFGYVLKKSTILSPVAGIVSWLIPVTELVLAVLLFFPRMRQAGLIGAAALMAAFTAYVALMLAFESKLPCTCGGIINQMTWSTHLWVNIGITGMCVIGVLLNKPQYRGPDPVPT